MEILGYILALLMGVSLGLLGGGGSILTVPILVYVLAVNPILATAYSLFVVGFTALLGAVRKNAQQLVDWKTGLVFAAPSLVAVFATRFWLVPAIPHEILHWGDFVLSKEAAIMIFFAVIMLVASYAMIHERKNTKPRTRKSFNYPLILVEGALVGMVTGIVGAGGGFLIVPALVLMVGLPMKTAVGTSLVIIAIKSLIGFLGDWGSGQNIDWYFLLLFTAFSVIGLFAGIYLNRFISAKALKKAFGWFVLLMGIFIIFKETVL